MNQMLKVGQAISHHITKCVHLTGGCILAYMLESLAQGGKKFVVMLVDGLDMKVELWVFSHHFCSDFHLFVEGRSPEGA